MICLFVVCFFSVKKMYIVPDIADLLDFTHTQPVAVGVLVALL